MTNTLSQNILGNIASALGLVLIAFGIWALGGAIYFAWGLFQDPDSISYFAKYFFETTKISVHLENGAEGTAHLVSWLVVTLLLLVLGKLGDWTINAGVRLLKVRENSRS